MRMFIILIGFICGLLGTSSLGFFAINGLTPIYGIENSVLIVMVLISLSTGGLGLLFCNIDE